MAVSGSKNFELDVAEYVEEALSVVDWRFVLVTTLKLHVVRSIFCLLTGPTVA